jgi:hypothetical protein
VDTVLELILVTGERRTLVLSSHTGSVANVLDRLDEWVETDDGGWVQKRHIVEVRIARTSQESESAEEFRQLDAAAGNLAQATMDERPGQG